MPRLTTLLALCALIAFQPSSYAAGENRKLTLDDGDRVLLIGDVLIERENNYGVLETKMRQEFPGKKFAVRNLGYSGDTPLGASRASFDPVAKGIEQLEEQLAVVKPTVAIIGYGMAASLEELTYRKNDPALNPDPARYGTEHTPARLKREVAQLMDLITKHSAGGKVRFVILGPIAHEDLRGSRPGLPNPAEHNALLAAYGRSLAELATEKNVPFVQAEWKSQGIALDFGTDNGIHLTERGYRALSEGVAAQLGWNVNKTSWDQPATAAETLRASVLRKNSLFFHRSRPANYTYIFGFRKREQGNNAVEIPKFDPLIETAEADAIAVSAGKPSTLPPEPKTPSKLEVRTSLPAPEFKMSDGLRIALFAENPLLEKPVHMNWDTSGRLWVATSNTYPQVNPEDLAAQMAGNSSKFGPSTGNDKVILLEDTNRDGIADVSRIVADRLLIPSGVAPDNFGGVYVGASTELLHLTNANADGVLADRRIVLSGFGTEDTHHIIHTFRYGPDARLYFNQSIYIHSHVETPHGVRRLNAGGIWRFAPESLNLDVFARGWVNTWGHAFDRWGRSLVTDGAGGEGIYYGFPGAAYQTAAGTPRILHGMNPGSPKYCGLEIVDGRHLPDDAQGQLITNDFRANRVCRFRLTEQGSGFASEKLPELIHSQRITFRPIDVKMGPDGAIYIADWYNPIIQHGEVDFRDERRDRTHGRIWRVTAKGRPALPRIDFTKLSTPELLGHLKSPESYARDMAKRVLFSRGSEAVVPELTKWLASLDSLDPDFERLRLEALRLRQGLDRGSKHDVDAGLLKAVLAAPDPRARAAAARIVCDWADRLESPVELLAPAVDDPSALVRLEGVRALATLGGRRAAELALHAVDHERDDALDYAVWLAARETKDAWLPAVLDGTFADDGRFGRVIFAVSAAEASAAVPRIVASLQNGNSDGKKDGKISDADRQAALSAIARLGSPDQLRVVFDVVTSPATPPAQAAALLGDLLDSHRRRRVVPTGDVAAIEKLVMSPDNGCATRAIEATAAWQVTAASEELAGIAESTSRSAEVRNAAIAALGGLPGDPPRAALLKLCTIPGQDEALKAAAIAALVPRSVADAATHAVSFLGTARDAKARSVVFQSFLKAKEGATTLAAALESSPSPISADAAKDGQQAVSAAGRQEPALTQALAAAVARSSAGTPQQAASAHAMNAAELDAFVTLVREKADAKRGAAIYARENLKCVTCHRIGAEGGKVGPNLTAIGASSPLDYVIDSLLYPAKNVKEGYNTVVVQTDDGQVLTGIQVTRSDAELVLRDAAGKEVKIPTADIEEESVGTSLMPAGLIDSLSREELADLVRYLSGLGK